MVMDWKKIRPWIVPTFSPSTASRSTLAAGLRHYSRQRDGAYVRYHLRIERSGQSLLIVAASEAVRLTEFGTIAAVGVLEGKSDSQIVEDLQSQPNAGQIVGRVRSIIGKLGLPNKRYPIFNLTDPSSSDAPLGLIAPFQADLELPREHGRLRPILEALWQAGIPHIRIVGIDQNRQSRKVVVERLCNAVQLAEDIGMIAGVRMAASMLMQHDANNVALIDRLAELGLDYVVVPWGVTTSIHSQVFGAEDYEAIETVTKRALRWEFPVVLEAALIHQTTLEFEQQLDLAVQSGRSYFEVFPIGHRTQTNEPAWQSESLAAYQPQHMRQLASWIEDLADNRRAQIVWLSPHSTSGPLTQAAIQKLMQNGPRAGADISIRIDSQGNVFAPRGNRISVGAIDRQSWESIWNHECFRSFRELVVRNDHCALCPMLTTCAVSCPADPAGWTIEEPNND